MQSLRKGLKGFSQPPALMATVVFLVLALGLIDAPAPLAAAFTWSPTGSLASVRYYHPVTLLSHGKVLMAGGNTSSNHTAPLNTGELYNDNPAPAIKLGKAVFILLWQD